MTVFPQSGIEPWNVDAFRWRLDNLRESFHMAKWWLSRVLQSKKFYCERYANYYDAWVTSAIFEDVPPAWTALYLEYRRMIEQAVTLSESMYGVCIAGGGSVRESEVRALYTHIDEAEIRMLDMIEEATP